MKKILVAFCLMSVIPEIGHAYTEVALSQNQGFASSISVSTTPTVFASSTTLLDLQRIEIWNYSADVMYINFTVQASSTTAAANGIKVFQSSENNESIVIWANREMPIYFTLAADSGTGALRVLQTGRKKR